MKKIYRFIAIGTFGIIFTAVSQILLTIYYPRQKLIIAVFIMYAACIASLVFGFRKIIKEQKTNHTSAGYKKEF